METPPQEPTLEMFCLTESEFAQIEERKKRIASVWKNVVNAVFIGLPITFVLGLANITYFIATAALFLALFLGAKIIDKFERNISKIENYNNYKNELFAHKSNFEKYQKRIREQKNLQETRERKIKRRQFEYWNSLNPYEFEKEIARVYELNGYKTKVTKGSGDGGIDIHLCKDGKSGIVQCKRYGKKVGPSPVRDLYGTMIHGKYNFAKIVCPAGFSDQAYEFSKGKNIELVGLKRIMLLVEQSEAKQPSAVES